VPANRRVEVDAAIADVDFDKHIYQIELDTTMGPIRLELFPDLAPGHVKNIIGLTKIGFYDGVIFHRVVDDFVIQAGCPYGNGIGGPGYTIPAEFNATKHVPGILSMARTDDPNSAGSQFFLCIGSNASYLDGKYTVFGKTADEESLRNVMSIGKVPTRDQRPRVDVKIRHARVVVKPRG
jgi:cyclophilin family peptidyl-prolyl cis-trans isomerase